MSSEGSIQIKPHLVSLLVPVWNKFHRQRQRRLYFASIHLKLTFQHRKNLKLAEAGFKFFLLKILPFIGAKISPDGRSRHHASRYAISSFMASQGPNVSDSTLMMQLGPLLYFSFKQKLDLYYCHNKNAYSHNAGCHSQTVRNNYDGHPWSKALSIPI